MSDQPVDSMSSLQFGLQVGGPPGTADFHLDDPSELSHEALRVR